MKAKFKIGNLIKADVKGTIVYGEIMGVVTRKEGYEYLTAEGDTVVENQVDAAYKIIATKKLNRKPRKEKLVSEAEARA